LQQTNNSIAADKPICIKDQHPRLIEKWNLVHYALNCVERVEHDSEPATYTEAIAFVDVEKWTSAMREDMQSLRKNATWDVVCFPKQMRLSAISRSSLERKVCVLMILQCLRQS
jgi:hypothetical protein